MGFKTGKTIGELKLVETILEMLQKRIMIIGHPDGDGLSDGADLVDDNTTLVIPNISSEYPGSDLSHSVPVENIAAGILAGHSIFLQDTEGKELQISFLQKTTVDLEDLADKVNDHPMGLEEALEELDNFDDEDVRLWVCEIGMYRSEDPHTAFETYNVAVAAESESEAREKAEEFARENIIVSGHVVFSTFGSAQEKTPDDFV